MHQADRNPLATLHAATRRRHAEAGITQRDLGRTFPANDFLRGDTTAAWIAMIATELH
jgi:hypothetical protein